MLFFYLWLANKRNKKILETKYLSKKCMNSLCRGVNNYRKVRLRKFEKDPSIRAIPYYSDSVSMQEDNPLSLLYFSHGAKRRMSDVRHIRPTDRYFRIQKKKF